jgi:hypothetical protein
MVTAARVRRKRTKQSRRRSGRNQWEIRIVKQVDDSEPAAGSRSHTGGHKTRPTIDPEIVNFDLTQITVMRCLRLHAIPVHR